MATIARHRDVSPTSTLYNWTSQRHAVNGSVYSERTGSATYIHGMEKSMDDYIVENYNKLRSSGLILMNPCEFSQKFHPEPVKIYRETSNVGGNGYVYSSFYANLLHMIATDPDTTRWANLDNESQIGAFNKASEPIMQALVTVGELQKSVQMVVGLKKRFAERFVSIFKDKSRHKTRRILDATGGTWLEARYGWRPLLADAESLGHALAHTIKLNSILRSSYTSYAENAESVKSNSYILQRLAIQKDSYDERWTSKTTILYKPNPEHANAASVNFGLTSLMSTAWELVPFSFMVDWFTNIGDWISAVENQHLIQVVGSCTTRFAQRTHTRSVEGGSIRASSKKYSRITGVSVPALPTITVNFDAPKAIDTFFIARQILTR